MVKGIKETAAAVGLSVHELRKGAKAGRYPFFLCGSKYMFDTALVEAAMREQMYANQEEARKCLTN